MNVDTLHSNNECDDDGCTRMISSWWWELTRRGDKQHDKMRCILLTINELAKLWTLNRMFGTEIDQSIDDFSFSIRHCLDTMSLKGKDTRKKKKRKKIHDLTYRKSYRKLHFFFFIPHIQHLSSQITTFWKIFLHRYFTHLNHNYKLDYTYTNIYFWNHDLYFLLHLKITRF